MVTKPIRGSLSWPIASERTCRTDSLTRRMRSVMRDIQALGRSSPRRGRTLVLRHRAWPAASSGSCSGTSGFRSLVLAASSPAAGAGANIGVSAVAALAAAVTHIRAGRIDWQLFLWMAPPSIVGAVVGGLLSGAIPGDALLVAIGVTLLVFGIDLLRPLASGGAAAASRRSPSRPRRS